MLATVINWAVLIRRTGFVCSARIARILSHWEKIRLFLVRCLHVLAVKKKSLFGPTANVGLFYRGRCQCSYREFLFTLELRIDFRSRIILLSFNADGTTSLFRSVKCSP